MSKKKNKYLLPALLLILIVGIGLTSLYVLKPSFEKAGIGPSGGGAPPAGPTTPPEEEPEEEELPEENIYSCCHPLQGNPICFNSGECPEGYGQTLVIYDSLAQCQASCVPAPEPTCNDICLEEGYTGGYNGGILSPCSSGDMSINGCCCEQELMCQDTDAGSTEPRKVSGQCSDGVQNEQDVCTSNTGLKEWYCRDNACAWTTLGCDKIFGSNYICNNGKCELDVCKDVCDFYNFEYVGCSADCAWDEEHVMDGDNYCDINQQGSVCCCRDSSLESCQDICEFYQMGYSCRSTTQNCQNVGGSHMSEGDNWCGRLQQGYICCCQ